MLRSYVALTLLTFALWACSSGTTTAPTSLRQLSVEGSPLPRPTLARISSSPLQRSLTARSLT